MPTRVRGVVAAVFLSGCAGGQPPAAPTPAPTPAAAAPSTTAVAVSPPATKPTVLVLSPGQSLGFTATERGVGPLVLRPVEPTGTPVVRIELKIEPSLGTLLTITNPFTKPLVYRAGIDRGDGRFEVTSTCPVRPGMFTVEHWPARLTRVAVTDFALVDGVTDCR